ncbi:MAG: bifunctional DNA-formamidopyrimidine glycosylase/DNA-(apurinic or apyrimidinic site) lyase [Desulfobulbaceae bacterium]|jgi:formamidopyrimidine-DNA glycosylase|nr:bifunctional DNA-formamidopyrimidine glycosylase/DNA-(apurinic or apyrimidinic site) lyase [Desulfobulbaceae bacterium]
MPELPEVETIRRGLAPLVIGKTIAAIEASGKSLRQPLPLAEMRAALPGQTITGVRRRAKYLLVECDAGGLLLIHLGMTGNLGLFAADAPMAKHCHVRFRFSNGDELRYSDSRRFGVILFLPAPYAEAERKFFAATGPEPFDAACSAAWLAEKTGGPRAKTPIKAALLNSALIAGIGNIYACESLFRAGINPQRAAGGLSAAEWQGLLTAIRETLAVAIACGGSSISDYVNANQQPGYFQMNFNVYGRTNQACRRCGTAIEQIRITGRSSFYCPRCQENE